MSETHPEPLLDLLPREEALQRLNEIVRSLSILHGSQLAPRTIAETHWAETGHRFGFGCCRVDTPAQ